MKILPKKKWINLGIVIFMEIVIPAMSRSRQIDFQIFGHTSVEIRNVRKIQMGWVSEAHPTNNDKTMNKEKVLIIKPGYSETLDGEIGVITSFGDVLRSTVLLHLYKNAHVTWLVDEKAFLYSKGNPFIQKILPYDLTSVLQLQSERFDTVINLEKFLDYVHFQIPFMPGVVMVFGLTLKMVLHLLMTVLNMY